MMNNNDIRSREELRQMLQQSEEGCKENYQLIKKLAETM